MNLTFFSRFAGTILLGAGLTALSSCQRNPSVTEDKPKHTEKPLNAYWTELNRIPVNLPQRTESLPVNYRVLKLDLPALRKQLATVHASEGGKTEVEMPLPNGRQVAFTVTESAVMSPQLAARYPQLKTYKGTSVKDPSAALRFELNQNGLKATITEGSVRYIIDPYLATDSVHYLSYERASHRNNGKVNTGGGGTIQIKGQPQRPVNNNE